MLLAGWGRTGRDGGRTGWRKWRARGERERQMRRERARGWVRGDKRKRGTSVGKGLAVVICAEPR